MVTDFSHKFGHYGSVTNIVMIDFFSHYFYQ